MFQLWFPRLVIFLRAATKMHYIYYVIMYVGLVVVDNYLRRRRRVRRVLLHLTSPSTN